MRAVITLRLALLGQRGHLFAWVPVCLAIGIGTFFSLKTEPDLWILGLTAGFTGWTAMIALRSDAVVGPLFWCVTLVAAGFALAGLRAHQVAEPVMAFRYYGPIEGTVVGIDRSASDAVRLTLADVRLSDLAVQKTPARVRVSLHGDQGNFTPAPGMRLGLTGHLSPPSGPVEPGGFDFQRHAWFQELGAVGYTRSPVLELQAPGNGGRVFAFRMALSQAIQARMPADVGGFAAAVTTGDRSGIPVATVEDLRISNLAHLLAISGLHMGLLAGFVFAAVRVGLVLIPPIGLRVNGKKVAAVTALLASSGYLAMSGGSVSTERAYVMTAVMLLAVLVDRRALSIRAVAMAALVVLVLRPEALLGPGFQMSFAATTALVAVFGWLREREIRLGPKWVQPIAAVVLSSLVAGLATAPFAAFHFNQVAHYGLPANLLSVPVMGTVVVPSAVLAALLSPLGLEQLGLWPMGVGLRWILSVAQYTSDLDGARGGVPSPEAWILPVLTLGGLVLVLWQGHARWAGGAIVAIAFGAWGLSERPDILIADTGGLVGVLEAKERALSKPKGQGFVARNWLENDGSQQDQVQAASLWQGETKGLRLWPIAPGKRVIHVQGKRGLALFQGCDPGDVVVFSVVYDQKLPCDAYDPKRLAQLGAMAIHLKGADIRIISARDVTGRRLWNDQAQ
ncbi:ComEC/Rec2 family competence protein [Shimia sp.]|uniref:ComEC/Rec2 family competence protein n=1 Tax=Shimia sp. TaxID=1954381 RepID=UPI003298E1EF